MSQHSRLEIAIEALLQAQKFYEASNYICAVILAGASQQVIHDLCIANGKESVIKTIGQLSGHGAKKVHNLIVDSYNKSKHADRDPNDSVFVSSDEARVLMTVAATDLLKFPHVLSKEVLEFFDFIRSIRSCTASF